MASRIISGELTLEGIRESEVRSDIRRYERIRQRRDLTEAELETLAELYGFYDEMRGFTTEE